jgi:two-component system clock-associated histidine kinase SasA
VGIPKELCDRIFEDRFRVSENDDQEGYGIGLAVCRRIIRAHYGQIWVDAAGKQGSCFHFTLPVY